MTEADVMTPAKTLNEGDRAPDFNLPGTAGDVSLAKLKGKNVVLYFYPKDDTPGCTLEGKDFSSIKEKFADANTVILGISKDSVDSHDKFCAKHDIGIPLISDEDGATTEAYGVWVEKNMYGKKYMGIERTTFLIDGNGKIAKIWKKVKVEGHANDVLNAAQSLN